VSPSWIRRREHAPSERHPKGHVTFQVLYRRGGREAKIETLGSFDRDREARNRRDLVAGWLALGLDPKTELAKLIAPAAPTVTFAAAGDRMISTRYDAADQTVRGFRNALRKVAELAPELASRAPDSWTVADVQELVAAMADDELSATTIETYLRVVKQTLDFADVEPNPARDRRVKLPARTRDEVQPPSKQEFLAILRAIAATHRLRLVVLEQTAMRIGELCSLPWGDVDVAGSRFRLSRERTKTRHPRWVQVPEWLMPYILDLCPLEDRAADRAVFGGKQGTIRRAMDRACKLAGVPLYSPHDLRHRRASLWHGQGVTLRDLMERGGWSRAEIAIDTYSHVMPLDEATRGELEAILDA
jgi:integrase